MRARGIKDGKPIFPEDHEHAIVAHWLDTCGPLFTASSQSASLQSSLENRLRARRTRVPDVRGRGGSRGGWVKSLKSFRL